MELSAAADREEQFEFVIVLQHMMDADFLPVDLGGDKLQMRFLNAGPAQQIGHGCSRLQARRLPRLNAFEFQVGRVVYLYIHHV